MEVIHCSRLERSGGAGLTSGPGALFSYVDLEARPAGPSTPGDPSSGERSAIGDERGVCGPLFRDGTALDCVAAFVGDLRARRVTPRASPILPSRSRPPPTTSCAAEAPSGHGMSVLGRWRTREMPDYTDNYPGMSTRPVCEAERTHLDDTQCPSWRRDEPAPAGSGQLS